MYFLFLLANRLHYYNMAEAAGNVQFSLADRVFIVSHAVVYQSSAKARQEFQQHFNRAPPARTTVLY